MHPSCASTAALVVLVRFTAGAATPPPASSPAQVVAPAVTAPAATAPTPPPKVAPDPAPPAATPAAVAAPPKPTDRPRLFVSDLEPQGATPEQARAFTDAVVQALSLRHLYEVVSVRDLQSILGAERQRQLLGLCGEEGSQQCVSDLSAAVTARFILSGQLARLGRTYQLTLQTVDNEKGTAFARSTRVAGSLEELTSLVPYLAAEATGSPLPPPPSKVLSVSLMAAGGGAVIAGGITGLLALSRAQALNEELCPGGAQVAQRCSGVNLKPRAFYVQKGSELAGQQALSIALLAGGAVVAGLGAWLYPAEVRATGVALAPTSNGVMLSGVLP